MGLGKTIQAIAIAAAYLKDHLVDGGPPTLVVVPAVVRAMWVNELEKWLDGLDGDCGSASSDSGDSAAAAAAGAAIGTPPSPSPSSKERRRVRVRSIRSQYDAYLDSAQRDAITVTSYRMLANLPDADVTIEHWLERSAPTASAIISAIGAIIDPDVIVIGGRLPSFLADRLAARLSYYSVPVRGRDREFPELLVSKVTGDAAALGASALCFNRVLL